jgi:hypothetical protein
MLIMITGQLIATPDEPLPYRVVVRRDGEVIRIEPIGSLADGNRALEELIRREREYEAELRWDAAAPFVEDSEA